MVDTNEAVVEKDRADGPLLVTIAAATVITVVVIIFVFMGFWEQHGNARRIERIDDAIESGVTTMRLEQEQRLKTSGVDPVPEGSPEGTKPTRFIPLAQAQERLLKKLKKGG